MVNFIKEKWFKINMGTSESPQLSNIKEVID